MALDAISVILITTPVTLYSYEINMKKKKCIKINCKGLSSNTRLCPYWANIYIWTNNNIIWALNIYIYIRGFVFLLIIMLTCPQIWIQTNGVKLHAVGMMEHSQTLIKLATNRPRGYMHSVFKWRTRCVLYFRWYVGVVTEVESCAEVCSRISQSRLIYSSYIIIAKLHNKLNCMYWKIWLLMYTHDKRTRITPASWQNYMLDCTLQTI